MVLIRFMHCLLFDFGRLFFWPTLCHWHQQSQSHHLFPMPPKRKDNSSTSAVSGPKAKRSKSTPTFRTPTTAGPEATAASEANSTKNRIVTLRSSASGSGRRGYRTQDLDTSSNSNNASPPAELSHLPSHIPDECDSMPHLTEESDLHPDLGTKSRPKQKNTTTVR
jgi:hypothetical protein